MHRLTLFYDGQCPLCVKEMTRLRHADNEHCLTLINIHSPACSAYPEINKQRAAQILHGIAEDGKLLLGLDATCQAWKVVGRGRWIGLSRWPIIRPITDRFYLLFARHRYTLSKWLTGKSRCDSDRCYK